MMPVAQKESLELLHPEILGRTETILKAANNVGAEIELLGAAQIDRRPLIYTPANTATKWVTMPLVDDPLIKQGEMRIPEDQLANLRLLEASGIEFDDLFIAHEIEGDSFDSLDGYRVLESWEMPQLNEAVAVPEASPAEQFNERLGSISTSAANAAKKSLVAGLGAGLVGTAAALTTMALVLDPIIFGVVTISGKAQHGEVASVTRIAQWEW